MINLSEFLARKGQIVQLRYRKDCGNNLIKFVSMQARIGLAYDNQRKVQSGRACGDLPPENTGLPWGTWEFFPYTILHQGNRYLRFYPFHSTVPNRTEFFLNGEQISREQAQVIAPQEFRESNPYRCLTIREFNVLAVI